MSASRTPALANGRPSKFPVSGVANAAGEEWFRAALRARSGDEYATANVDAVTELNGAQAAAYATAIREGGASNGKIAGALAVFFDWTKQASAVLYSVRLSNEERSRTRRMIVDAKGRVIADSEQSSGETKRYELQKGSADTGAYRTAEGSFVGHALTAGYESYEGMGWYGVIEQRLHRAV
jgi:hypothetical protein